MKCSQLISWFSASPGLKSCFNCFLVVFVLDDFCRRYEIDSYILRKPIHERYAERAFKSRLRQAPLH